MYSVKNQEMTKLKVALLMLAVSMVGVAGIMSIDTFKGPHVTMKVPDRVVQEDAETGKKCPGG